MKELARHFSQYYPVETSEMKKLSPDEAFCMRFYHESGEVMIMTIKLLNAAFDKDEMDIMTNIYTASKVQRPAISFRLKQQAVNNDKVEDFINALNDLDVHYIVVDESEFVSKLRA